MARTQKNMRGRTSKVRGFSMLVHAYFRSPEYAELSPRAVKALVDLSCPYRGGNNGDLCAARKIMLPLGWKSQSQLVKALDELLAKGWITITRMGGKHVARLYAVSFIGIDACGGKLDVSPCSVPSHLWKHERRAPVIAMPRSGRRVIKKDVPLRAVQSEPPCGSMERAKHAY